MDREKMKKLHKCPVCDGRGKLPFDFYTTGPSSTTISLADVECKSCNGKGYIIIQRSKEMDKEKLSKMDKEKINCGDVFIAINKIDALKINSYFIILSLNNADTYWIVGCFWDFGSKYWGGARQCELTTKEIFENGKFIGNIKKMIERKRDG